MKLVIGSDHGGFRLKEIIKSDLEMMGHEVFDCGTFSEESCDYPDIAESVSRKVAAGEFERGILVCGTGIGMAIAANKVKGIRAAVCGDVFSAKATRAHNDANVLTLGERTVGPGLALEIVHAYLESDFEGGRHQRRVDKIANIEE